MRINNIEILIIPNPHKMYARSEARILPVKEIADEKLIKPFGEDETITSVEEMVGRNITARRFVLKDPYTNGKFALPLNTSLDMASEIDSFETGHEILPFNSPGFCARRYYSTDVDPN